MDVVEMFGPVTKWATTLLHEDSIPEVIRKAVRVARTEKPGAVHIELPEDIASRETAAQPLTPIRFRRPVPDDKIVDRAFELLRSARRPVIIAGNGCIRRRASKQLRLLCEQTGIGVLSTFMAKGAVARSADYCLFTIGLGAKDLPTLVIDQADLVIALGFDMVEYHPRLWNPCKNKRIIHADFLPAEIDEHYQADVELVGDLAHTLWMFNERLASGPPLDLDLSEQRRVRASMLEEFAACAEDETEGSIRPQKVLWDVRATLGPHDILLSDVGAHKMWIARYYQCDEPNTCLIPNGFCSMGFALPGAIGASLVHPDRHVLAIAGDGGFLMNVQEMETARRLNSNIVVMVWEDGEYGLIKWKQQDHFDRHSDLRFTNPDWKLLAESFGWNGHVVARSTDLADTLETALREAGPSLVVVPIDYRENLELTRRMGVLTQTMA